MVILWTQTHLRQLTLITLLVSTFFGLVFLSPSELAQAAVQIDGIDGLLVTSMGSLAHNFTIRTQYFGPIVDPAIREVFNPSSSLMIRDAHVVGGSVNDATYLTISPNPGSGEAWIVFPLNDAVSDWTYGPYMRIGSFDDKFFFQEILGKKTGAAYVPMQFYIGPHDGVAKRPLLLSLNPNGTVTSAPFNNLNVLSNTQFRGEVVIDNNIKVRGTEIGGTPRVLFYMRGDNIIELGDGSSALRIVSPSVTFSGPLFYRDRNLAQENVELRERLNSLCADLRDAGLDLRSCR